MHTPFEAAGFGLLLPRDGKLTTPESQPGKLQEAPKGRLQRQQQGGGEDGSLDKQPVRDEL